MTTYTEFLAAKQRAVEQVGPQIAATDVHPLLHDWQAELTAWAVRTGRAALWADTGLGKTFMQVEWARLSGSTSLIVAPLAVCHQTVREAAKLGVQASYTRDGGELGPGAGAAVAGSAVRGTGRVGVVNGSGVVVQQVLLLGALGELGTWDSQVPAHELADDAGAIVPDGLRGDVELVPEILLKPDAPDLGDLPLRLVRHRAKAYGLYGDCHRIVLSPSGPCRLKCTRSVGTVGTHERYATRGSQT